METKEKRDYIKDGKTKDLHEADENHLRDAYNAAHEVLDVFPEWEKIECCENGDILSKEIITKKILTKIV